MSRRVVVVDSNSSNRIRLAGEMRQAHFAIDMVTPADALADPARLHEADLVVLGYEDPLAAGPICRALREGGTALHLPIIGAGRFETTGARLAALSSGLTDVFDKRAPIPLLLARIRSLLKLRDGAAELRQMDSLKRALGFAEDTEGPATGRGILVITNPSDDPHPALTEFSARRSWSVQTRAPESVQLLSDFATGPDLIIVDARSGGTDRAASPGSLFRLIADIRAMPETRHAGIIAIIPQGAPDLAIMALDLGASDLVTEDVGPEELAFRAKSLIERKAREDRFRDFVRNGLKAAITDPLTGLHNRRFALPQLGRLMAEMQDRPDGQVAVLLIDVDHFKAVNDRYGHAVGDKVLVGVAGRLRTRLRAGDLLARVGGEEFLVVLPGATARTAEMMAERLRHEIERRPFALDDGIAGNSLAAGTITFGPRKISVTVSVGLALGPEPGETADQLYARADVGLYAAKAAGRNQVGRRNPAA
jgi:two-component system cell cycle response regulator